MDRLDSEFTKSLQNIEPNCSEYFDRLEDEVGLYSLIIRSNEYFTNLEMTDAICHMSMKRLQHIYFQVNMNSCAMKPLHHHNHLTVDFSSHLPLQTDAAICSLENNMNPSQDGDSSDMINKLCAFLYRNGSASVRAQAILCQAHHHALHDRFAVAKDLLLLSPVQVTVHHADVGTKILYNRTMAQLGLCAFRQGKIADVQACLKDISGVGSARELLGQESYIPFHMHLNLELLECTYLTCAMLSEISLSIASSEQTGVKVSKRVTLSPFQRALQYHTRRIFSGPPETARDHILSASNALAEGDWQQCSELITKAWSRLPPGPENTRTMLRNKIQEEGLRIFLFSNKSLYIH